jgi:F-type H+-transporting ATPase subunit epsilon
MKMKILLPNEVFAEEEEVSKLNGEAENGAFCLLEHHVDFVATLVPGLLSFVSDGKESFVAVDAGTVVKRGFEVLISVKNAVRGGELGSLKQTVEEQFLRLDDRERKVRSVLSKLEADLARSFLEMEEHG